MLIRYSSPVKKGEKILVEAIDVPHAFTKALVRHAAAAGGHPLVMLKSNEINRALMRRRNADQWDTIAHVEKLQMQNVQCYIGAARQPQRLGAFRRPGRQAKNLRADRLGNKSIATCASTKPAGASCAGRRQAWPRWPR